MPTVLSAVGELDVPNRVTVRFSRPLDLTTATNLGNYSINHGGPIVSATLDPQVVYNEYGSEGVIKQLPYSSYRDTVTLTTTANLSGSDANILTVNNVRDLGGTFVIATNTQVTISLPIQSIRAQYSLGGNELVVLEAEHYNQNVGPVTIHQLPQFGGQGGNLSWIFTTAPPLATPQDTNTTFSGTGAMIVGPNFGRNAGAVVLNGEVPVGPRMHTTILHECEWHIH